MNNLQRWEPSAQGNHMVPYEHGEWVCYTQCKAIVDALREQVRDLQRQREIRESK